MVKLATLEAEKLVVDDLAIKSQPESADKDTFTLTFPNLKINSAYSFQFQYVFEDGTLSEWSPGYNVITPSLPTAGTPRFQSGDAIGGPGFIKVNWDGKDYTGADLINFDRVDIFIIDNAGNNSSTFGNGSKPVTFFKVAGTKTIVAPTGSYTVFLKSVNKYGNYSASSTSHVVSVTGGITVEDPTLPTGLTVSQVPFGLAVNWNGTYISNDTFSGFKAIKVYAASSDLGASTTSGLTETNLVGLMTIDQTTNRINIGLDNLRQALGLASNAAVYNDNASGVPQPWIYLYYIATNLNDVVYKVSGTATYTRINSSPTVPNKANYIDLTKGIISIENLEAGNGQFTSWLRTGTVDGARIELSGTSSFTPSGASYAVLPGFSVYSSGSTPIFRADLSGNVTFGGYTPTDITTISNNATLGAGKNKVFRQATVPTAVSSGDVWINTANPSVGGYAGNNTIYVASAAGTTNWQLSKDQDITSVVNKTVNLSSSGNIVGPVQVPAGQGSIYSSKSSYGDSNSGWYLGYNGSTPVIDIGSGTAYMRWNGSSLSIKGDIDASTITGSTFKTGTSGNYIEISSNVANQINLVSANSGTTNAGFISSDTTTVDGLGLTSSSMYIRSPKLSGSNISSPQIAMWQTLDSGTYFNAVHINPGNRNDGSYLFIGGYSLHGQNVKVTIGSSTGSLFEVNGDITSTGISTLAIGKMTYGAAESLINDSGLYPNGIIRNIKTQTTAVTHNQSASGYLEGTILFVRRS